MTQGFFAELTTTELAGRLRAGETSAVELTRAALRAIAELDGELNAFTAVDRDGAVKAAEKADAELAEGLDRGPLHGIPVAVKDIIEVAGLPTTMGSAHFADHVSTSDAECVRRLRAGGAVLVGKTTTHEFAFGPTGDSAHGGPSRNPHDTTRITGGSSGGSGAAVAAGMVPLALGTDTGGSVRIPAALCGVVGFKPAFGAIPVDGVFPLAQSLDHVGVLARSPQDCRAAYRVLAGLRDAPSRERGETATIGWLDPDLLHPADPEVTRIARAALDGLTVREAEIRDPELARGAYQGIQASEAYANHAERLAEHPELYTDDVRDRLRASARIAGWQHVRALAARDRWRREVGELLSRVDLLALPTTCVTATEVGRREITIGGTGTRVFTALLGLTSPWNVAGVPAVSVPAGALGGLPVGLQLVGRPGQEDLLLAVAARIGG
ncbi:aspartyl-tRNA(Asn)/glutamyl-tRNA(Gln) amidotransferase subunit A [Saccharopolyspora kobensis]|uniref:Aspartyl-tRNA(Asn)/glutamyl-tRNA(Gln) amidotransferase subunit A n=3 Tax=Saccharopolyspora kobensis TaxID=146035 RepID=A0A1H5W4M9_9PSEU|nr:amidase [Saccharopolyspora kobensis]SEF94121.1 aspartyl-tRNA(Asn)/glutamyl-tRNA(Gln) amidotransferase subunit A [Saccharopolyspora kobensis]SFD72101.1 aspartyl-tRNA(Asn)/glutamyl-tRNA(Gln) amidotransferase subunit A [Saccharopolyspora kobensis]